MRKAPGVQSPRWLGRLLVSWHKSCEWFSSRLGGRGGILPVLTLIWIFLSSFFLFCLIFLSSDLWPGAESRCKERTMPSGEKPTSVYTSSQYSPWLYTAYHLHRDDLWSRYNMGYPFPCFFLHPICKTPFSPICLHCVLGLASVWRIRLSESQRILTPVVKKVHCSASSLGRIGARSLSSFTACHLICLGPVLRESIIILSCISSSCLALSVVSSRKLDWTWVLELLLHPSISDLISVVLVF